jgi:hypothetical protein
MPTATTSQSTGSKPRAKRAATSAKATRAKRAGSRGATKAKATTAGATRTRTVHRSESAARQAQAAVFGDYAEYAERAVLIPVGAALIARDRVVDSVSDTLSTYSSTSKTQAQLRRFERRGATARSRLEREVRKARVRVERQLRERRRGIESTVSELEERRDAFTKSGSDLANRVPELANEIQERILSLV